MNDLAEKALHGLDVARRQVGGRPMLALGILGFLVSSTVVVAGGQVRSMRTIRPLSSWLGLEDARRGTDSDVVPGTIMLAALVALVLLWIFTVEVIRRLRVSDLRVWWVVGAWAAPFALGPPLMDSSPFTYAAYGLIQRGGGDPYTMPPSSLGDANVVAAIDPGSRGTVSSAGPLGSVLHHLAVTVSGGSALGAVIVLRLVGVLTLVAIGRLVTDLGGTRRGEALAMSALNPLTLLYVVSTPHLDGLMIAFALAAIVAATQRRWLRAVALACVSGSLSGQGFVLVPILITVHCLGRRSVAAWRLVARDLAVAAVVTVAAAAVQRPDGFGWVSTVSKQFSAHTPYSIASAIGKVLTPIVEGASFDDLAASGRITAVAAAVCTIAYLVATARHRALEHTVGYALLAVGLLAPNLYPWYVLWGALCLAPTAFGERRVWIFTLSCAACVLLPPGFRGHATEHITAIAFGVVAIAVAAVLLQDHRRAVAAAPTLSVEG